MDIEDIYRSLERAYKVESILETLLSFEDVLERTNLYAYDHTINNKFYLLCNF